jgi:hypothetical protein
MTPEMWDRSAPFREEATARGIPADDIERWLATARPCATLTPDGDGPVVGRFGGPLLLPAEAPDPAQPFVASIDFAALPAGATDLPLPPDGHLLLFAHPETGHETTGSAVYVPAGSAVVERDKHAWNSSEREDNAAMFEEFPQGPLRVTVNVSLPYHEAVEVPGNPLGAPFPGHPRAEELVEVWETTRESIASDGTLQIGGYADQEAIYTDPVADAVPWAVKAAAKQGWDGQVSDDVSDWVLLADWRAGWDVTGWESAAVHWVIQREDLAARRFDRTFSTVYWNP